MASTGRPWTNSVPHSNAWQEPTKEPNPEKRRDLSQDIHFQLWRSFQNYHSRCSLRTWVYRVAHHVAVSHIIRERRTFSKLVDLEELELLPDKSDAQSVRESANGSEPAISLDSAAQAARSPGHCFLSRRHGCGIDGGDHGLVARQRGNENSSNQEHPREAIPPTAARGSKPCRMITRKRSKNDMAEPANGETHNDIEID